MRLSRETFSHRKSQRARAKGGGAPSVRAGSLLSDSFLSAGASGGVSEGVPEWVGAAI